MRVSLLQAGRQRRLVEVESLLALALQAAGRAQQAQTILGSALIHAETGGILRTFLDLGPAMRDLLADFRASAQDGKAGLERDRLASFCTRVLAELARQEAEAPAQPAESTVRSHIKSIYAKLGAHRRLEAVERARGLGLL
jgi:LuxR family maltose regulon positive regulatory protein